MNKVKEITVNQIEDNSEFWKQGWEKGFTGFHQNEYNPTLLEYFKDKDLKNKTIFVPLCGKSLDMIYLAELGANVIGVEIVKEPVEQFFIENKLDYQIEGNKYSSSTLNGRITIINDDIFKLQELGEVHYLYDRASNIALPQCIREDKYYPTIKKLITDKTGILLLTIDHEGSRDFGPPYPVTKDETLQQYPDLILQNESTVKSQDRFQKEGIDKIQRIIWAK